MEITTIKIQKETKERLDKLKENKGETYDDLIKKMLWLLNTTKVQPEKARAVLRKIDETRARILKQKAEIERLKK